MLKFNRYVLHCLSKDKGAYLRTRKSEMEMSKYSNRCKQNYGTF